MVGFRGVNGYLKSLGFANSIDVQSATPEERKGVGKPDMRHSLSGLKAQVV